MTTAKLGSLDDGHGLTQGLVDRAYQALQSGASVGQVVVMAVLEPVGWGGRKTSQGRKQHVTFDAIRVEVVPVDDESRIRLQIEEMFAVRTSKGQVMRLPLGFADEAEERRLELEEKINDFADAHGITPEQLSERWWTLMEGTPGAPKDWHRASGVQTLGFAHYLGAVEDAEDTADPAEAAASSFPDEKEAADAVRSGPDAPEAASN